MISFAATSIRLTTDMILRLPPFNLTDEVKFNDFKALLGKLGLTTDKFWWGEVYKKDCAIPEHKLPYTDKELQTFIAEFAPLFAILVADKTPSKGQKKYEFTCGAPLVGKTTFMRQNIDANKVWLDIEAVIMPNMQCYKDFVAKTGDQKAAYEYYRDLCNYFRVIFLAWLLYNGFDIADCGVNTDRRVVESILPTIKSLGYEVTVDFMLAPRDSRVEAGKYRKTHQNYYQSTPSEEVGRVAKVFLIMPEIMGLADKTNFYWNHGEFWLSKTLEESQARFRRFAWLDKAEDPENIISNPDYADILPELIAEVTREIADLEKRAALIAMFTDWLTPVQNPLLLEGFNAATAASASNVVLPVVLKTTTDVPKLNLNNGM